MKKFDDIEKKNPFKVPDIYFNNLSETLNKKIKQPIKVQKNYYLIKVAVAAVISVFIVTMTVLYVNDFNVKSEIKNQQFAENTIIDNFDESTIVNEMIEDTLILIQEKIDTEITDQDDADIDYVAESIDYESLLAEL